jgi:hypothetical protein
MLRFAWEMDASSPSQCIHALDFLDMQELKESSPGKTILACFFPRAARKKKKNDFRRHAAKELVMAGQGLCEAALCGCVKVRCCRNASTKHLVEPMNKAWTRFCFFLLESVASRRFFASWAMVTGRIVYE